MYFIPSDGPRPCDLLLVGERPGREEHREGRNFVGPAGQELWDRMDRVGLPPRPSWFVANIVRTFSTKPPSCYEIARDRPKLLAEIRKVKPKLIVTIGAHALRWFYPEADPLLERVHGLPRGIFVNNCPRTLIPCYHSAAALRQPGMYQRAFTNDLLAVKAWLDGEHDGDEGHHLTRRATLVLYDERHERELSWCKWGSGPVGCDTEGQIARPECVTMAQNGVAYLFGPTTIKAQLAIDAARSVVFHYGVHDLRVLWKLGLTVPRFDDTMLMAYLLGEPQGLKNLAFRLLGLEMDEYADLIRPLDETRVRTSLEKWYEEVCPPQKAAKPAHGRHETASRSRGSHPGDRDDRRGNLGTQSVRAGCEAQGDGAPVEREAVPARALSAVRRLLAASDPKDSATPIRKRLSRSKFAPILEGAIPKEPTWADLPGEVGVPYACADAHAHEQAAIALRPRLIQQELMRVYLLDRGVVPMIARTEDVGLAVDGEYLTELGRTLHRAYDKVCRELRDLLGHDLNPKAAGDVAEVLFDDLGVTPTRPTKSGKHLTTQDKYLEARKGQHAAIPLIMRGRELWKLKGGYCDTLPGLLREGRYHPEFSYTRTLSGRLTEPVILLIPKHSQIELMIRGEKLKLGKAIRRAFIATRGHRLVSVDLSQIELRVLAHVSRDPALIKVFKDGRDPHSETAHHIFGAPAKREDQDESKHRLPAKKGNFGAFMGLGPTGLTEQVQAGGNIAWSAKCPGCADPRADHAKDCDSVRFFREYFSLYKGVRQYIDDRHAEARRTGYVRDMWGRRIDVTGIWSTSRQVVKRAEREAQATPIQAGADGISKKWGKRIWDRILTRGAGDYYCEPWLRVHDDTILEVSTGHSRAVRDRMLAMVPQELCIATTAEGTIGVNWGMMEKEE